MSFDIQAIRRALAAQIRARIADDIDVFAYPSEGPTMAAITVYPSAGDYVSYFTTMGANGNADLSFRLKVEVAADSIESVEIKLDRLLGSGLGNTSSIVDAVMYDRTLGGTVGSCVVLSAVMGDPDVDPGIAWLPVEIILSKQNAQV